MSDVSMWRLLAFMGGDPDGEQDESRTVAEWQLPDVLRWCTSRGYDNIYLCRSPGEKTRFERAEPVPVRHHMHIVEGSRREPGDEAA